MDTRKPGQTPDATTPPAAAVQPGDTEPRPGTGSPAPAAHRRRNLGLGLLATFGALFLIAAVLSASIAAYSNLNPSHAGQVIFTTDAPTAASAATCQLGHQVKSVSAGTSVYATYFYQSRMNGQAVAWWILKNGLPYSVAYLSAVNTNNVDCMEDGLDLNTLAPGTYEFKLELSGGEVVSNGALTVTPHTPLPGEAGLVVFTTDAPTNMTDVTCQLGHQVTSIPAGSHVYASYFYKSPLTGQTVSRRITSGDSTWHQDTLASTESNGLACWNDPLDLSALTSGTYGFKLEIASGEVVSEGTLVVTPPVPPPNAVGRVLFTTDAPTDTSNATCQLGHQVTSVSAGSHVYANYFYKSPLTGQTVSRSITSGGGVWHQDTLAPTDSNGVTCFEDRLDLAALTSGSYDFKLEIASGEVVSEGTLVVTPPVPPPNAVGRVLFTTDAPTDTSNATCQLGHQVTSVSAGSHVYANYFYKSPLTGQTVSRSITFEGGVWHQDTLAPTDSNGVACFEDRLDLAALPPGSYDFKLKTASGEVVSEGTLIVKP